MKKNRNLYIFFKALSFLLVVAPVIIFNAFNYQIFTETNALPLTVAGLVTVSTVCFSVMLKLKNKVSIFLVLTGTMLILLSEIAFQLGVSMLLVAGANLIDKLLLKRIYLKYKERWYNDTGRQVVITRTLEE